jgi:predicted sulfurtransferase
MPLTVAAFYQFAALPDFRELREPLRAICAGLELKGSVLLAQEGINGTLAGSAGAIDALIAELRDGELFGGRLDNLELKFSPASAMPFQRLKIRLKKEIVTLGDAKTDPAKAVGVYVDPADWNDLIGAPDMLVIDTRNAFEVAMGSFAGAVDPGIESFGQFKDFAARARSTETPEDCDVLHRRHPLRKGQLVPIVAGLCRGLSPQGRHPEISGSRAGEREPLARRMLCVRPTGRARPRLARARNRKCFR